MAACASHLLICSSSNRSTGNTIIRTKNLGVAGLLSNFFFGCACLLRFVFNFYPSWDVLWDYPSLLIHIQAGHVASYIIWVTLTITCFILLYMIENLRGEHKLALGTHKVILSIAVILYHLWMIQFVYSKWGHHLAVVFQTTLTATVATFILHATYQMDTIFANLHAQENEVSELASKWSAYVSIAFNVVMPLHVVTVITAAMEWSLPTILVFILVGCEFYHRYLAIRTFLRLLHVMYTRDSQSMDTSYLSCCEEEMRSVDKVTQFLYQNTLYPILLSHGQLVTGYENSFKHLKNRSCL